MRPDWAEGWWSVVGGLAWAAFWVVVILIVVALIRGGRSSGLGAGSSQALRVLEERYARGEITREEFLERRGVLSGTGSPGDTST